MSNEADAIAEAWRQAPPAAIHPELDETGAPRTDAGAREATQELLDAIGRHLDRPAGDLTILDYGAGTGRLALHLARHFERVVLADTNPTYLARAGELLTADEAGDLVLTAAGDFELQPIFELLPIPAEPDWLPTADVIVSLNVFLHLPADTAGHLFALFARTLPAGGLLAIQIPIYDIGRPAATWTSVGTWTPAMLHLAAAATGLDILREWHNPGAYQTGAQPGPHHHRLHILRRP